MLDAPGMARDILGVVELLDSSLSVSEISGKGFEVNGRYHGHVIDPRTGHPTGGAVLAAVRAESATATDALATALLVLGSEAPSVRAFADLEHQYLSVLDASGDVPVVLGRLVQPQSSTNMDREMPRRLPDA